MLEKPKPMDWGKSATVLLLSLLSASHAYRIEKVIYSDDFNADLSQWMIEQHGGSARISSGVLDMSDSNGTTAWFKQPLNDSTAIEYNARILSSGAALTDLNCFWMALDPRSNPMLAAGPAFFGVNRPGVFSDYNDLHTYYVGFGANGNATFRFRRYYPANAIPTEVLNKTRDGNRVILADHDTDGKFKTGDVFLVSGTWYKIRVSYFKGAVECQINGVSAFTYQEQSYDVPYNRGFFAFRTTAGAHAQINSVRIYQITDMPVTIDSHFKSRAIKNRRSVVGEIAAGRNAEGQRRLSP
jgi:hypothetical protein